MNALEPLVGEARERLVARARREGLVTVGYDVMDSPPYGNASRFPDTIWRA